MVLPIVAHVLNLVTPFVLLSGRRRYHHRKIKFQSSKVFRLLFSMPSSGRSKRLNSFSDVSAAFLDAFFRVEPKGLTTGPKSMCDYRAANTTQREAKIFQPITHVFKKQRWRHIFEEIKHVNMCKVNLFEKLISIIRDCTWTRQIPITSLQA